MQLLFGLLMLLISSLLIVSIGGRAVKTLVNAWRNGKGVTPDDGPEADGNDDGQSAEPGANEARDRRKPTTPRIWS